MKTSVWPPVTLVQVNRTSQPRQPLKSTLASAMLMGWLWMAFGAITVAAQDQPTPEQALPPSAVISKSTTAIGYEVGGGSTKVDLKGTELMPDGGGQAKVEIKSKAGRTSVDAEVKGLKPPSALGSEFLTYVLWAVTPEGTVAMTAQVTW